MSLIAEGFVMNEVNTPTRVGELIETIEEIYNIPTPRVGMLVYVKDEGRCYIIRSLKGDVVAGVEVSGAKVDGYELWDIKATEEEMLKRIQGTSEESNPYTDGFKFIGHFTSVDALSEALDNLKYNNSEKGQNRGYFRFTYLLSQAEVVNYLHGLNKVIQVIRGNFTVEGGKIKYVDGFGVIVRSYTLNKGWSDWSIVIDSDTISNIENSIEDKVNSAIAGLVDTAPEDLDTLKEIADWIATHKEGAADMVANISKNATNIASEVTRAKSEEKLLGLKIDSLHSQTNDIIWYLGSLTSGNIGLPRVEGAPKIAEVNVNDLSTQEYVFYTTVAEEVDDDITFELVKDNTVIKHLGVLSAGEFDFEANVDIKSEITNVQLRITLPVAKENSFVNINYTLIPVKTIAETIAELNDRIDNIPTGGGGDITATPTEEVINDIEPTLVSTAIRKTTQVLTDAEKEIARGNIGAVGYNELNSAITNAITNTLNTAV